MDPKVSPEAPPTSPELMAAQNYIKIVSTVYNTIVKSAMPIEHAALGLECLEFVTRLLEEAENAVNKAQAVVDAANPVKV